MAYIGGNPPPKFTISVTLGADRVFTVNRVDPQGNPVNWDATVSMVIDIDKANPTKLEATITGNQAEMLIPRTVADLVKPTTRWRLVMTDSVTERITPITVGNFERDDGG